MPPSRRRKNTGLFDRREARGPRYGRSIWVLQSKEKQRWHSLRCPKLRSISFQFSTHCIFTAKTQWSMTVEFIEEKNHSLIKAVIINT